MLGFRRDPGLRVIDVALAMHKLDQLSDIDFGDYRLTAEQAAAGRRAFADWPRHPGHDRQGERAHTQAQQILAPPAPVLQDSTRQRPGAPPAPLAGPARPPPPGPTAGPRR